jgi:hypothetical protein
MVIGLSVIVPAGLIHYGNEFNAHTSSTVGGPVTVGICIAIAIAFDAILWLCLVVFLAARSSRRATRELRAPVKPEARRA